MNIAVYSLTRDRLEYTQHCFLRLHQLAGVPFHHIVVDNGSQDGTQEWLEKEYKRRFPERTCLIFNRENRGISLASNQALDLLPRFANFDLICKVDNDCEVVSENVLGQMAEILVASQERPLGAAYLLSPRVEGINRQPERKAETMLAGRRIGLTAIVGGLFHCAMAKYYLRYRFPANLPIGSGQDDHFCHWWKKQGGEVGYVERLQVNHYETTDGQCLRYPQYFDRKREEMRRLPNGTDSAS